MVKICVCECKKVVIHVFKFKCGIIVITIIFLDFNLITKLHLSPFLCYICKVWISTLKFFGVYVSLDVHIMWNLIFLFSVYKEREKQRK